MLQFYNAKNYYKKKYMDYYRQLCVCMILWLFCDYRLTLLLRLYRLNTV